VIDEPAAIAEILRLQTAGEGLVDPTEHASHLRAIRGVRLQIDAVRAKFKYGGNLDPAGRARIVEHLEQRGQPGDEAAAAHARRRLEPRSAPAVALPPLPDDWRAALGEPDLSDVTRLLTDELEQHTVFPPLAEVFNAFALTPFDRVQVVLLGQDPYHGPGQAHGLAFSVRPPTRPPPSLKNVFTELRDDLGVPIPAHGDLTAWAQQGVLMLNTVLTVRAKTAGSHRGKGWESFTDEVIRALSARREGLVFLLWGKAAQEKAGLIDASRHLVLRSAHPSPYSASAGFFGSRPFSAVNRYLEGRGAEPVDWRL
jgi:uracil-DNA glycosylase